MFVKTFKSLPTVFAVFDHFGSITSPKNPLLELMCYQSSLESNYFEAPQHGFICSI